MSPKLRTIAPMTREKLSDPPPVVRSLVLTPQPHPTPSYGYAWRLTIDELRECMVKHDPGYNSSWLSDHMDFLTGLWKARGYDSKYGVAARPELVAVPYREGAELEAFIRVFSNASQKHLDRSQEPEAEDLVSTVRQLLHLTEEVDKTLKWHCLSPFEPYQPRR